MFGINTDRNRPVLWPALIVRYKTSTKVKNAVAVARRLHIQYTMMPYNTGRATEFIMSDRVIAIKYGKTPYIFFARSRESSLRSDENISSEDVTTELLCAMMRKKSRDALLKIYVVVSGIRPQARHVKAVQENVRSRATRVKRCPLCCRDARIVSSFS